MEANMLSDLLYRLRALFQRKAVETELDEELRYHVDREAEKYRQAGASAEEAMRRARIVLGGPEQVRQQCREARGTRLLEDLAQDVRYGLRMLMKNPGLTFVIVLSLAIGIGANTAIFSVTSTLLLKPLPYAHPERLAILWLRSPGIGIPQDWPSPGQYHDIKAQNHVFEETAIAIGEGYTLSGLSKAMRVDGIEASSSLLPMLGVKPLLGRIFTPDEDRPGKPDAVVLTYGLWKRAFGGDPNLLGRSITLNGKPRTVVGILPQEFQLSHEVIPVIGGIDKAEIFMPLPMDAKKEMDYGDENYNLLARLKPGVTMQQAQADISIIAARLREEKHRDRSFTISVVPLMEQVVGDVRGAVLILLGAVALVLLIACTNVANLLLACATGRQKEIAMRTALGAGRGRLVMQLLTESVLLSLMGGVAGLGVGAEPLRGPEDSSRKHSEAGRDRDGLPRVGVHAGNFAAYGDYLRTGTSAARLPRGPEHDAQGGRTNLAQRRPKCEARQTPGGAGDCGAGAFTDSACRRGTAGAQLCAPAERAAGIESGRRDFHAGGCRRSQVQLAPEEGSVLRRASRAGAKPAGRDRIWRCFRASAHSGDWMGRHGDRRIRATEGCSRTAGGQALGDTGLLPDDGHSAASGPLLHARGYG
jgi:hypothetical protein